MKLPRSDIQSDYSLRKVTNQGQIEGGIEKITTRQRDKIFKLVTIGYVLPYTIKQLLARERITHTAAGRIHLKGNGPIYRSGKGC
jgi:hypothetical protein